LRISGSPDRVTFRFCDIPASMKTILFLFACFCTLGSFSQEERIGFVDEPDTSVTIWLSYFRTMFGDDPECDTLSYITDSTHFEYFPLDGFTFVRKWYHLREGTTVELTLLMDGSWLYVQKKGEKELFYGKCQPEKTAEFDLVSNSVGEDSVIYREKLVPVGTWSCYYQGGYFSGKYKNGQKNGTWVEYRSFLYPEDARNVKYAEHYYRKGQQDSSLIFSMIDSQDLERLLHAVDWDLSRIDGSDYLFFYAGQGVRKFGLLADGKVKEFRRCGVGMSEDPKTWSYNVRDNILFIGGNACKVLFANDETLILKWPDQ
jgi:hypothetical protein